MPETRRPSTRLKSERQSKRKQSTPPPAPQSKVKRRSPTPKPEPEPESLLPTKIKDHDALPTLPEPQRSELPRDQYKTIAESGVLAASLDQSREKWLRDGIFEKYWVKGTKKNPPPPDNPPRESMVKIESGTLIIEPHHFDVTFHYIKNSQITFLPPQKPVYQPAYPGSYGAPGPYGNAWQQHGPPLSGHPPTPGSYQSHPPYQGPSPQPQPPITPATTSAPSPSPIPPQSTVPSPSSNLGASAVPVGAPSSATTSTPLPAPPSTPASAPAPSASPAPTTQSQPNGGQLVPSDSSASSKVPANGPSQPAPAPAPAPPQPREDATGADPVIQMLAARAAENPDLKALMKVVAQGHANAEQLAIFQKHIDELNSIINERKRLAANGTSPNPRLKQQSHPPTTSPTQRPSVPAPVMTPAPPPRPLHPATGPPMKQESLPPYYPPRPVIKSKGPVPPKLHDSVGIVFEFANAPNTRYVLPRKSIYEVVTYESPNYVLLSFILARKGTNEHGGKYDEAKMYYEPVTLKLQSATNKIIEHLEKAVDPQEQVKKDMIETIEKTEAAESKHLATRLPRTEGADASAQETRSRDPSTDPDVPQDVYGAPTTILSLRRHAQVKA